MTAHNIDSLHKYMAAHNIDSLHKYMTAHNIDSLQKYMTAHTSIATNKRPLITSITTTQIHEIHDS